MITCWFHEPLLLSLLPIQRRARAPLPPSVQPAGRCRPAALPPVPAPHLDAVVGRVSHDALQLLPIEVPHPLAALHRLDAVGGHDGARGPELGRRGEHLHRLPKRVCQRDAAELAGVARRPRVGRDAQAAAVLPDAAGLGGGGGGGAGRVRAVRRGAAASARTRCIHIDNGAGSCGRRTSHCRSVSPRSLARLQMQRMRRSEAGGEPGGAPAPASTPGGGAATAGAGGKMR